ncbi:MAG: hypothetical protein ABSH51_29050 [Solirubrobacteraceae bacterium]
MTGPLALRIRRLFLADSGRWRPAAAGLALAGWGLAILISLATSPLFAATGLQPLRFSVLTAGFPGASVLTAAFPPPPPRCTIRAPGSHLAVGQTVTVTGCRAP